MSWTPSTKYLAVLGDKESRPHNVRFISPLIEYGYRPTVDAYINGSLSERPILLYLPGFDGTFLSPFLQFPELDTVFDVRCMTIGMNDRSTFAELTETVLDYIRNDILGDDSEKEAVNAETVNSEANEYPFAQLFRSKPSQNTPTKIKRDIYLAGESFGGILASEVALQLKSDPRLAQSLKGLTLINPATCFDRSQLAAEADSVMDLNPIVFPFGLLKLLPLFTDEHSLNQLFLILRAKALPSVIDNAVREAYLGRMALALPFVLPIMTQGAFKWRITEWLTTGCQYMASRIKDFERYRDLRVLIVAGEKDETLPSIAEAERLVGILPAAQVHVVEGAGHATTCGSRVDLAALFRNCFNELLSPGRREPFAQRSTLQGRTEMKEVAAAGVAEFFGMEPRYDNNTIGLSPLMYWDEDYFRQLPRELC